MTSEKIAHILLKKKCVFFRPEQPFIWASGIESPIYCDLRLLISELEARTSIIESLIDRISLLKVNIIAGTATAGIPWASWIADRMNLPLVYIRPTQKEHGRQNYIEGQILSGSTAVVIEDLISTGRSSIEASNKLRDAGLKIKSIASIFNYNFEDTHKLFLANDLHFDSLCNFEILAKVAYDNKIVDEQHLNQILAWRKRVRFHEVT